MASQDELQRTLDEMAAQTDKVDVRRLISVVVRVVCAEINLDNRTQLLQRIESIIDRRTANLGMVVRDCFKDFVRGRVHVGSSKPGTDDLALLSHA